jgi:hypothetical protein
MKGWIAAGAAAAAAGLAVRQGLRKLPEPFPAYDMPTAAGERMPIPAGLPEPVARYLEVISDGSLPVIHSAVLSGRMTMRLQGLALPGRWRFIHEVGTGYRHYLEITVFGRKVAAGQEWYLDGQAVLDLPMGRVEGQPRIDQAANMSMWGEYLWLPSVLATGQWEPVDAATARLLVGGGDSLVAWFDPDTGLLERFEALRWRDADDEAPIRWVSRNLAWTRFDGIGVPAVGAVQWADQAQPWLRLSIDDVVWNADVEEYLRGSGT